MIFLSFIDVNGLVIKKTASVGFPTGIWLRSMVKWNKKSLRYLTGFRVFKKKRGSFITFDHSNISGILLTDP